MNVVDKIQHYQRSLERCNDNETKTLHCIDRLYKLPVTVQHLQETGVGRTVNALRKFDGSVGDAAKALVAKWKTMVVDEESSGDDEDEACVPDASEGYSDRSNSPKFDKDNGDDRNSSKHKSDDSREKRSSDKHDSSSRHRTKNSSCCSKPPRDSDYKSTKNGTTDKRQTKMEAKCDSRIEKKSKSSRHEGSSRYDSGKETTSSHGSSSNKSKIIKSDDTRKDSSRVSSSSSSNNSGTSKSWSHDSHRKRKLESSSSERETSKRHRSVDSPIDDDFEDPDDVPTQLLSRDSDDEPTKILPDTSIATDSDEDKTRIKIKRETPESPPTYDRGGGGGSSADDVQPSVKTEKSSKSKSRESSNKSSTTSCASEKSRRDGDKHEKSKSSDKTATAVDHRKNEKRKDENPNKESSSSSSKSTRSGSCSSSKNQVTSKDKESSRSKKESSRSDSDSKDSKDKFKEPKEKKVKKKKLNGDGGIDCNSGASFAEALGMCLDRPMPRKKATPLSPSSAIVKTIKTEPGTSSSSSSSYAASSSSKSGVKVKSEPLSNNDPQPLSLLAPNVKLEPLNVDLASTLPEISPNYKPLPAHFMNPVHRKQEEANALSQVIYAKTQRTKVYSGMKAGYTTVPSLYDMCLRVLMENIDGLGFTGGIPYDILKPVLERATADQLFTLENYNPYLIEDTDPLWEFHCNKEFRKFKREEMDSWRDTYMRCRDEREVKLRNITANIKESIDKSVPVRSAKLAYVDNVVKPPRNILRKQAKYGTARTSTPSSDLKKKLILSGGSNSATNIAVPPPPSARLKTSSSSGVVKKNKAPLMAKALQLIKGRYKR